MSEQIINKFKEAILSVDVDSIVDAILLCRKTNNKKFFDLPIGKFVLTPNGYCLPLKFKDDEFTLSYPHHEINYEIIHHAKLDALLPYIKSLFPDLMIDERTFLFYLGFSNGGVKHLRDIEKMEEISNLYTSYCSKAITKEEILSILDKTLICPADINFSPFDMYHQKANNLILKNSIDDLWKITDDEEKQQMHQLAELLEPIRRAIILKLKEKERKEEKRKNDLANNKEYKLELSNVINSLNFKHIKNMLNEIQGYRITLLGIIDSKFILTPNGEYLPFFDDENLTEMFELLMELPGLNDLFKCIKKLYTNIDEYDFFFSLGFVYSPHISFIKSQEDDYPYNIPQNFTAYYCSKATDLNNIKRLFDEWFEPPEGYTIIDRDCYEIQGGTDFFVKTTPEQKKDLEGLAELLEPFRRGIIEQTENIKGHIEASEQDGEHDDR